MFIVHQNFNVEKNYTVEPERLLLKEMVYRAGRSRFLCSLTGLNC